MGNLSVDWSDSLKKLPWNTEVVNLLAVDFQTKVKSGIYSQVVFNDETMNLDNLRLLCINKLCCTQTVYQQHTQLSTFSNLEDMDHASHEISARNERRQHLDRSNTQKHGTLQRHQKIVEQNRHQNRETWDTIMCVIEQLNIDGMSGDETDTPPGVIPKVTRRVDLPWLSPDITWLLHAVESFTPATYKENMTVPIGNSSLPHILEQKCMAHNSIVIQKLLHNWYDDTWFNARFQAMPKFHSFHHFKRGILAVSQWTCTEHKEMQRVVLGLIAGAVKPHVFQAAHATLNFIYYAQYQSHTDTTLAQMQDALDEFHVNKLSLSSSVFINISTYPNADGFNLESPEQLHINYAKDAYQASSKVDYIAQMTHWLELQEAVFRHSVYLDWVTSQRPICS
ncbi:hypothetical protein EDD22DRAFT_950504 [Suillus occidentalis]|nr:hypothetical protein EDD22DRAFT_950504 [Suillus occidentalis]